MTKKKGFLKGKRLAPTYPSSDNTSDAALEEPPITTSASPPRAFPSRPAHPCVPSKNTRAVQPTVTRDDTPSFLYISPVGSSHKPCIVIVDFKDRLRDIFELAAWQGTDPVRRAHVRVVDMPGKGLGLVAARAFKPGEIIVSERPTFCARRDLFVDEDGNSVYAPNALYHRALSGLCDAARNAFMALKNVYSAADGIQGIIMTNALGLDVTPEFIPQSNYAAVYPTLSHANHSCTPAAQYHFELSTFEGQLLAVRDISAGEEITQAYIYNSVTRDARREILERQYRFVCACEACSLPPALIAQSDARRVSLGRLICALKYNTDFPDRAPLEVFEQGLAWAVEEGLPFQYGQVAALGAKMANMNYDAKTGKMWTERAFKAWGVIKGEKWSATALEISEFLSKFLGV